MADEDVLVISEAAEDFIKLGVSPLMVDHGTAEICHDMIRFYEYLVKHGFGCAKTYSSLVDFEAAYQNKEIDFPVFVKPRRGYGSQGIGTCSNMDELTRRLLRNPQLIIQEFLDGPEYSIDAYMDIISGKMVSAFIKERIATRTGASDKAISVLNDELFVMTEQLTQRLGASGPVNVQIFRVNGKYYYNEVNPCLGSSYILAHACGVDFSKLITNNLDGIENTINVGKYKPGIFMMKYDEVLLIPQEKLL